MAKNKNIVVEEAAAEEPVVEEAVGEKLVTIRLPLTRENQEDVFVRVNHRTWLIKRGETVSVPESVVEVLENSERAILEGIEYQSKVSQD